jgi:hypothetical protein
MLTLVVVADRKPTTAAKALSAVMGESQRVVGRCRLRLSTLLPNRPTTCTLTLQVGAGGWGQGASSSMYVGGERGRGARGV